MPETGSKIRDRLRRPPRRPIATPAPAPDQPSSQQQRLSLRHAWRTLTAPASTTSCERKPDGLWPARYETLDLWRAVIGIGIVLHHIALIHTGINTGRVILFFVISGYCIAAVAESSMRRGISPAQFLKRRLWRIYPTYLIALLFFIATRFVKKLHTGIDEIANRYDGQPRHWWGWIENLTLTPWLNTLTDPIPRPGSNPVLFVSAHWSLAYEQQFYIVVALLMGLALAWPKARLRWTIPCLIPVAILLGLNSPQTIRGIFIEFWTAFATGALVYYRLSVIQTRRWKVLIDLLFTALVIFSLTGLKLDTRLNMVDIDRSKWHEWMIAAIFGVALIVLRPFDGLFSRTLLTLPLRIVGRLSYSLFLIHQFNMVSIAQASRFLIRLVNSEYVQSPHITERPWFDILTQIFLHLGLAAIFWLFFEYPFTAKREHTPVGDPRPAEA